MSEGTVCRVEVHIILLGDIESLGMMGWLTEVVCWAQFSQFISYSSRGTIQ